MYTKNVLLICGVQNKLSPSFSCAFCSLRKFNTLINLNKKVIFETIRPICDKRRFKSTPKNLDNNFYMFLRIVVAKYFIYDSTDLHWDKLGKIVQYVSNYFKNIIKYTRIYQYVWIVLTSREVTTEFQPVQKYKNQAPKIHTVQ